MPVAVFFLSWQLFGQDLGQIFGQDFGQTGQQKQQHSLQQPRGARASRARPFIVSADAVVSVVLFDQNLDQKIDLSWPGLWVKPWAWPGSSPEKIGPEALLTGFYQATLP